MVKVFILPAFEGPDKAHGGIRRVIDAMRHFLPQFGVEVVDDIKKADVVNYHAGNYKKHVGKPLVASCHGLYWTDYEWESGYWTVNEMVIEVMRRAEVITAPSNWVANALRRGLLHEIVPIHHGINPEEWRPGNGPRNYVLWNKARADIISQPEDIMKLSEVMPGVPFKTTIGRNTKNVEVIGVRPYHEMRTAIMDAGVYLSTARETFGIGTLEAMASGVPVAGWAFGGNEEIIKHGETGYLAPYGDYEALALCVNKCLSERHVLGENARKDVGDRWLWPDKIEQYAEIFKRVHYEWTKPRPKVSIIVPAHNLGNYLPDALRSVQAQTDRDFECVVVDDDSKDNTHQRAQYFSANDARFKVVRTPRNLGLCGTRNYGVKNSIGKYIVFLDADDLLAPNAVEILSKHLDKSPDVHIAYGKLNLLNEEGDKTKEGGAIEDYDFNKQLAHIHQFPIGGAAIRRQVLERSGGFRVRDWRAEDAAWISRVTSFGYRAQKCTNEAMLYYRVRSNSKSMIEARNHKDRDGDWTSWLGWRVGADNAATGHKILEKGFGIPRGITPFGAQTIYRTSPQLDTSHRQDPLISVIIPVGPGHDKYLYDCLDSLLAQTISEWEAIVVNDTGHDIDTTFAPWAKVVTTSGGLGAGAARNEGIRAARGKLLLFLDADDWLLSNCMHVMINEWMTHNGTKYIYTDYISIQNGKTKHEKMKPYLQSQWKGQHAVTILISKQDVIDVGGFDTKLGGWEDWDLPLKLAITGRCGQHVPTPTFVYRLTGGSRREWAFDNRKDLLPILKERYEKFYNGGMKMAKCCGGSKNGAAQLQVKSIYERNAVNKIAAVKSGSSSVRMEFIGSERGTITFQRVGGAKLKRIYRGSASASGRYINAHPEDAKLLESTGKWRVVSRAVQNNEVIGRPHGQNIDVPPQKIEYDQPKEPDQTPTPIPATKIVKAPETEKIEIDITPKALKILKKAGVNLEDVNGTGKDGRITVMDARNHVRELA